MLLAAGSGGRGNDHFTLPDLQYRAISDGLRQEASKIRVTCVNPGVVESELASTITHVETMKAMDAYRSVALQPADIARAVRHIIESPESVDTTEITIRPHCICKLKNNFYIHVLLNRSEGRFIYPCVFHSKMHYVLLTPKEMKV